MTALKPMQQRWRCIIQTCFPCLCLELWCISSMPVNITDKVNSLARMVPCLITFLLPLQYLAQARHPGMLSYCFHSFLNLTFKCHIWNRDRSNQAAVFQLFLAPSYLYVRTEALFIIYLHILSCRERCTVCSFAPVEHDILCDQWLSRHIFSQCLHSAEHRWGPFLIVRMCKLSTEESF